jgi:hypothetical protein
MIDLRRVEKTMFKSGGLLWDLGVLFALGLVAANYQAFNTLAQTGINGIAGIGAVIQGRGPQSYGAAINSGSSQGFSLFNFGGASSGTGVFAG